MSKDSSTLCLVVAPHPDDETIGAAIWMRRHGSASVILAHVTDGSPKDVQYANAAGFADRDAYAAARRNELYAALEVIGIQPRQCIRLGLVDQTVHEHLPRLIQSLAGILKDVRPAIVLAPSYEGGHPDHDSTAFAICQAMTFYPAASAHKEYRLYHAGANGGWETRDFLPRGETDSEVLAFSPEERQLKARMAAAFRTQADVLARFQFMDERFRTAPLYDFNQPPHQGDLLYEKFGWGLSWEDWRKKAWDAAVRTA